MKINPDSSMHITLKERFEQKKLGLTYQEIKLAKLPSPWFSQFDSTNRAKRFIGETMNSFMSVDKGLPKNDDRALYLNVKLSDKGELEQFNEDGGMINVTFLDGFVGQAYDENGHVCLGLPLDSVTHWKYADA